MICNTFCIAFLLVLQCSSSPSQQSSCPSQIHESSMQAVVWLHFTRRLMSVPSRAAKCEQFFGPSHSISSEASGQSYNNKQSHVVLFFSLRFPQDVVTTVTARKRSCGKVMFSQESVCSQGSPNVTITHAALDFTGSYPSLVTSSGHHWRHRYLPLPT